MALIDSGPLAGFYRPDYQGGSLVDLMASLIRARGGESAHTGLGADWERQLSRPRHVVLLVVDGLGLAQRQHYLEATAHSPFLGQREPATLSSVFPATTAAAVTTLMTGASPAEHGILGWFLNLHDLGMVSAILPGITRTEMPSMGPDFALGDYLAIPCPMASLPGPRIALAYRFILESRFSHAASRWTETHAIRSLHELENRIVTLCDREEPSFIYAYWPDYDGFNHQFGPRSPESLRCLTEIDGMLGRLTDSLAARDSALVVTADHGFVETPVSRQIDLSQLPGLYDSLATLPSGDVRAVSLFVRPARLAAVRDQLATYSERCTVVAGEQLLEAGVFGPGIHHPALYSRVGDLVLLAKEDCAFSAPIPGHPPHAMLGNHGGMTAPEMLIPLWTAVP